MSRRVDKWTGRRVDKLLAKALTDDTDEQNKQIFLLTTHRDLKVREYTDPLLV